MAAEAEGITLLSLYGDDEEDEEAEFFEEEKEGGDNTLIGKELQCSDDVLELSKTKFSMDMDCIGTEREGCEVETSTAISLDSQKDDRLQKFLPLATTLKCSKELQEKINKFLAYKRAGKNFNEALCKKKDYRNPNFLQHAVRYQDIKQIGTCFSTEVFDPHGYDKSDFYDEIEADMKREIERKAQERKIIQKIDFVSGGIQSGETAPAFKIAVGVNNEFQPVLTTVDAASNSLPNKKSKWDKE